MMMHSMNEEEPLQDAEATTAGEETSTEESARHDQEAQTADAAARRGGGILAGQVPPPLRGVRQFPEAHDARAPISCAAQAAT